MLREHTIQFLECTVVFLLLTNAVSVIAATYAIWIANGFSDRRREGTIAVQRKADGLLRRAG
jgi:hypothetical protein